MFQKFHLYQTNLQSLTFQKIQKFQMSRQNLKSPKSHLSQKNR
jgi:hypothetical protein